MFQIHVLSKEMVYLGMYLLKHVPLEKVDKLMVLLSKLRFGSLSKFGISRPKEGPFFLKLTIGRFPTIDIGSIGRIKKGKIKVYSSQTIILHSDYNYIIINKVIDKYKNT